MPQPTKPGIPWAEITDRYCDGASAKSLAKEYGVSRQAIAKRGKREGWFRTAPQVTRVTRPKTGGTKGATAIKKMKAREPSPLDRHGLRTAENAEIAIEHAREGDTYAIIAGRIGMSPSALKAWRDEDPDFHAALYEAMAEYASARVKNVTAAAERGDARAAQWILERHPCTRVELGSPKDTNGSGQTLQVFIAVPRATEPVEPKTIEGEATEAAY